MRTARFLLAVVAALAAAGCMRQEADDGAGRGLLTASPSGHGLFNSRPSAPQAYAQQPVQKAFVLQYVAPKYATPQYAASQPQVAPPQYGAGGPYIPAPASYTLASPYPQPYP